MFVCFLHVQPNLISWSTNAECPLGFKAAFVVEASNYNCFRTDSRHFRDFGRSFDLRVLPTNFFHEQLIKIFSLLLFSFFLELELISDRIEKSVGSSKWFHSVWCKAFLASWASKKVNLVKNRRVRHCRSGYRSSSHNSACGWSITWALKIEPRLWSHQCLCSFITDRDHEPLKLQAQNRPRRSFIKCKPMFFPKKTFEPIARTTPETFEAHLHDSYINKKIRQH